MLSLPLVVLTDTFVMLGPLPAIAGVAAVAGLLRVVPVTNLLWFAYLMHTNRRPEEQVPVWYARVRRTEDESEVMVRLKGLFSRGNVAPDDLVSFWGFWRNGVLIARHGLNHRTQTTIAFRRSLSWIWLVLTIIAVGVVALHLHDTWTSLTNAAR